MTKWYNAVRWPGCHRVKTGRAAVADPIGLTDLEVCHHDGADTEVRAPAARLWNRLVSLFVKMP